MFKIFSLIKAYSLKQIFGTLCFAYYKSAKRVLA